MKYLVVVAVIVCAGCFSIIVPSDKNMIHGHRLNAMATQAKIAAIYFPPGRADWDAVQMWWREEKQTWDAMDNWAHGRKVSE